MRRRICSRSCRVLSGVLRHVHGVEHLLDVERDLSYGGDAARERLVVERPVCSGGGYRQDLCPGRLPARSIDPAERGSALTGQYACHVR
jgi:hypothetical protein